MSGRDPGERHWSPASIDAPLGAFIARRGRMFDALVTTLDARDGATGTADRQRFHDQATRLCRALKGTP